VADGHARARGQRVCCGGCAVNQHDGQPSAHERCDILNDGARIDAGRAADFHNDGFMVGSLPPYTNA
jgi:hypothetical protein